MKDATKKYLWLASVIIFLVFCALVGWFVGIPMVRLAREPEAFRLWVDRSHIWGRVAFVAMVVIQVIVALIPGEPLELAAGYAFGAFEGTILSMLGILLGSWFVFAMVRRFGVKLVEVFFSDKEIKRLHFLKDPKKTTVIVFLLMLIPGTPKDLLSYFAGLTPLRCSQWLTIVGIARIPSLVTSTLSGAAAGDENYMLAAVITAITLVLSGCGLLYYRSIGKTQDDSGRDSGYSQAS